MNIETIANHLRNLGWGNVQSGERANISFDIVCWRYTKIKRKWYILVQCIDLLDKQSASIWQATFETVKEKSLPSFFKSGHPFIICLIVQKTTPEGINSLKSDEFGFASNAVGKFLVVDLNNNVVHGKTPNFPLDAKTIIQSVKDMFRKLLSG